MTIVPPLHYLDTARVEQSVQRNPVLCVIRLVRGSVGSHLSCFIFLGRVRFPESDEFNLRRL